MNAAEEIAKALDGKPSGAGYMCRCPVHEDRTASLKVDDGPAGLLVHCHAGCDQSAVVDALKGRGLWPERDTRSAHGTGASGPMSGMTRVVAEYDYRDANGNLVYQSVRLEPKSFRQRRPDGAGAWIWNLQGIAPVPYRLPELKVAVDAGMLVFVVEGEKDANALAAIKVDATTNSGGAGKWRPEFAEHFKGAHVAILPDNDPPGRAHAEQVAANLAPVAASVKVLQLPNLPPKGDVSDWLAAGGDADQLVQLAYDAPVWTANSDQVAREQLEISACGDLPGTRRPIDWAALAGRQPPARKWADSNWLLGTDGTLLSGSGGVGKSTLAQCWATSLVTGTDYIGHVERPLKVLAWMAEDDANEIWRRQLNIAAHFGTTLQALAGKLVIESFADRDATLAAVSFGALAPTPLMEELRAQVQDYGADYVILDNIARLYGGLENDRHSVTQFIAWLRATCAPAGFCLLGHPAKAVGSEYSGSTAWDGSVRARLWMSHTPPGTEADDDAPPADDVRYLARRKANYASINDVVKFTLTNGVLVPEVAQAARPATVSGEFAKDIVRRAMRTLAAKALHGNNSSNSPNYLPRQAAYYQLLDRMSQKQFAGTMRQMILAGEVKQAEVGRYPNRSPRMGLVLTDESATTEVLQ